MIDITDRVHCAAALSKITTAEKAAEMIQDGMNLGMSGFTLPGIPRQYPWLWQPEGKNIPLRSMSGPCFLDLKSIQPWWKPALWATGCPIRRTSTAGMPSTTADPVSGHPYQHLQPDGPVRLPAGSPGTWMWPSSKPAPSRIWARARSASSPPPVWGGSCGYVQSAKKVIVEVNVTQPLGLEGMHDCYVPWILPTGRSSPSNGRKTGSALPTSPATWTRWQPSFPATSRIPPANWRPSPMMPGPWAGTWWNS